MRFLKLAVASIILLSAIVLGISFMLPSKVIVRRSIDINAEVDSIYRNVSDLNNWNTWLVNRDSLPIIVTTVKGRQTLKMGNTSIYIKCANREEVDTDWQVEKGKIMPCYINFLPNKNTPIVTVQWQFEQELKWYPWEKFSAMISDKVLGPFIEQSLHRLKEKVEGSEL